jgi:hypothetical protein
MARKPARCTDRFWGLPSFLLNERRNSLPRAKQQVSESDRSSVSMAEVTNEWISSMAVRGNTV